MKMRYLNLLLFVCGIAVHASGQIISTVAGSGITGYTGDGIAATSLGLDRPWAVALDASGNIYVADRNDQRIRKISTAGIMTTVVGTGAFGFSGDGGPAISAQIYDPSGIAIDGGGNMYIADYTNNRIRKVTPLGVISTYAGNGTGGYNFDGVAATAAQLNHPKGLAVDASGNLYIADYGNNRIRKVTPAGIISTIAGDGTFGFGGDLGLATFAKLFFPSAVAVDGAGNVFIADENNQRIRKVNTSGFISTYAGTGAPGFSGDGAAATTAQLFDPSGLALDASGNLYIAEYTNNRIRKVTPAGIISTIAGTGTASFSGDGGAAVLATLNQPSGVAIDGTGNVYISDQFNDRIRKINTLPPITGTATLCVGGTTSLSDASGGGTWSSSNTTIATVGLTTGLVFGAAAGTANITYTLGANFAMRTVTVAPVPVAGTITGPGNMCVGSPALLSDAAPGGVWSSSNTSVATVTLGTVSPLANGTATISYTVTNSCGTASALKTVTVGTLSAGVLTGPSAVCVGSSVTLSNSVPGGAWSVTNAHAFVAGGLVFGVSGGVDTVLYTVSGSCGTAVASHAVTVNITPFASPVMGPVTVCIGTPVALSDAAPGGVWSTSNTNASVTSTGIVSGLVPGSVTVSYTISNVCGTSTAVQVMTVGAAVTVSPVTGASSVCVGSSIPLSDATPGGVWGATNSNAVVTSGGLLIGINPGSDTIAYTITAACGSASATKVVTVVATPAPGPITGPAAVCIGSFITLSNSVGGGVWSSSNTTASVTSGGVVLPLVAGVDTISYTITNACGTAASRYVITVNPLPNPGVISGSGTVCVGSSTLYTESVSGGAWGVSNTSAFVTSGGLVIGLVAGVDTVSYTVTNSCGSLSATRTVTVVSSPSPGTITGASSVCVSTSILLSGTVPGGVWTVSNSKANITSGGTLTGMSAGIDTVYYTVTTACGSASTSKTVTINAIPGAGTITGSGSVCIGSSVVLSNAVTGGTWGASNTNVFVTGGIVTGLVAGTSIVSYTVSNVCGASVAVKTVTVSAAPIVGVISASSVNLCAGTTLQLSNSVSGGVWSSSDTMIARITSGGLVTGKTLGSVTFTYAVTSTGGCSSFATKTITISDVFPSVVVLPAGLAALCSGSVTVYVVASSSVSYQWLVNGVNVPGATSVSYVAHSAGSYSVRISDAVCTQVFPGTTVLAKAVPVISFSAPNTLLTGVFKTYEWYLNGSFIPGATTASIIATKPGNYTVVVLDDNLCIDTSAVYRYGFNTAVAGLITNEEIHVYPNPATSILHIDAPVKVNVRVLSVDGKLLKVGKSTNEIDVADLAAGLYLLQVYDEKDLLLKTTKFARAE